MKLFRTIGYDEKEALVDSKCMLRIFRVIDLKDVLRDEGLLRRLIAKGLSIITLPWLPKAIRSKVKRANLRSSRVDAIGTFIPFGTSSQMQAKKRRELLLSRNDE